MLIKVTEQCRAACTHCCENATPSGEHMSLEMFKDVIAFCKRIGDRNILISGGEPSDHPQFGFLLELLRSELHNFNNIFILSHGKWLEDHSNFVLLEQYSEFKWQFTADPLYYPNPLNEETQARLKTMGPNILVTTDLSFGSIFPLGRARNMGITEQTTRGIGPRSFNLRSFIVSARMDFVEAVHELRDRGKECTPSVNVDGSISHGESRLCHRPTSIYNSLDEITTSIRQSQCNTCGMITKLPTQYQDAIGYGRIL